MIPQGPRDVEGMCTTCFLHFACDYMYKTTNVLLLWEILSTCIFHLIYLFAREIYLHPAYFQVDQSHSQYFTFTPIFFFFNKKAVSHFRLYLLKSHDLPDTHYSVVVFEPQINEQILMQHTCHTNMTPSGVLYKIYTGRRASLPLHASKAN